MIDAWRQHCQAEFEMKDVDETMNTMGGQPDYVLNIPTCVGGVGMEQIRGFYANDFVNKTPEDTKTTRVQLTVDPSSSTMVDELIFAFTHDIEMPWMLPGVRPTGKHVAVPLVVSIGFSQCGNKVISERIYWDQASVLQQVGMLDKVEKLPIVGKRQAMTVQAPKEMIGTRCRE